MSLGEVAAFTVMLAAAYALVRFIAWIEPDIAEALSEDKTAGAIGGEGGAGADRLVMHRNSPSHEECGEPFSR